MRVGWLHGPPGVGKSTTAWQLYLDLAASAVPTAYVDIDQLGMCYPERSDDPDRYRLKGRVLAALLPHYARAGARVMVVSGVLDPTLVGWHRDVLTGHDVTFARLTRADGASPQEVAAEVRGALGLDDASVGAEPAGVPVEEPAQSPGQVLWVCGPPGVGKSVAAWAAYSAWQQDGATAAFLDLAQLGFAGPLDADAQHALQAANVAAAWDCFHAAGATHLVLSGAVGSREHAGVYRRLLPAAHLTLVRLRADRGDLTRRVHDRGAGGGPRLAGDALVDQPDEVLDRAAHLSWAEQQRLDAADVGDVVLDTTGATVAEVGAELVRVVARRTA